MPYTDHYCDYEDYDNNWDSIGEDSFGPSKVQCKQCGANCIWHTIGDNWYLHDSGPRGVFNPTLHKCHYNRLKRLDISRYYSRFPHERPYEPPLSEREKILLNGMIHFANQYNDVTPDVGFGSRTKHMVTQYLESQGLFLEELDNAATDSL